MNASLPPILVEPGAGLKAGAAATGGSLALFDTSATPGGWVPPHIHHEEEEAWYVLEGVLTFRFADREVNAPAGTFVLVPRGNLHSFGNTSDAPARFLMMFAPAGMEGFFAEMDELAASGGGYSAIDAETSVAIARKYNMEMIAAKE